MSTLQWARMFRVFFGFSWLLSAGVAGWAIRELIKDDKWPYLIVVVPLLMGAGMLAGHGWQDTNRYIQLHRKE